MLSVSTLGPSSHVNGIRNDYFRYYFTTKTVNYYFPFQVMEWCCFVFSTQTFCQSRVVSILGFGGSYVIAQDSNEMYWRFELIAKLEIHGDNKTGSHQRTRAVCSIFAEIHPTLTPRCIDALFGVRIHFKV